MATETILPLLQRFYSLETIAKEPWDDESVLYVPKDRLILADCTGAESIATVIYLNTLNLRHTIRRVKNANEMSPSGIGPLLKCGRFSVGEFEPIVSFCNVKIIKSIFRENYAWPLSDILYRNEYNWVKNRLNCSMLWDCDRNQVINRFNEVLESLNRKLDGNLYLIDNKMTEIDIALYSYIKFVKSNPCLEELKRCLQNFSNLTDFYANLDEKYKTVLKEQLNI